MSKHRDLTGYRSGRLLVVSLAGYRKRSDGRNRSMWLCRCDCGNEVLVPQDTIVSNTTRSCGCFSTESRIAKLQKLDNRKAPGYAAATKVYNCYRGSASQRGHAFNLTRDEFAQLAEQPCSYCGKAPSNTATSAAGTWTYSGLDRVDNARGYEIDNVVPCCTGCNLSKGRSTVDRFQRHMDKSLALRRLRNALWFVFAFSVRNAT